MLPFLNQMIEEKLTLLHIVATHEAFISGRRSRAMFAGIIKVNLVLCQPFCPIHFVVKAV